MFSLPLCLPHSHAQALLNSQEVAKAAKSKLDTELQRLQKELERTCGQGIVSYLFPMASPRLDNIDLESIWARTIQNQDLQQMATLVCTCVFLS